jgi:hypothetical protein
LYFFILRLPSLRENWAQNPGVLAQIGGWPVSKDSRINVNFVFSGAGDGNRTNPNEVMLRYRLHLEDRHLASGTINVRLAAVRQLAYEAADSGLLSPDLAAAISGPIQASLVEMPVPKEVALMKACR